MYLIKAVAILQRWFRAIQWNKYMRSVCANYTEDDPITQEPVAEIPRNHVVFMTCPTTKRFMACDAVAWASYFAISNTIKHPCTRLPVAANDVWMCYITARPYLHTDVLATYRSTALRGMHKPNGCVTIVPTSPLFGIQMFNLSSIPKPEDHTQKLWTFIYALRETRRSIADSATVTRKLNIVMTLPASSFIQIM